MSLAYLGDPLLKIYVDNKTQLINKKYKYQMPHFRVNFTMEFIQRIYAL